MSVAKQAMATRGKAKHDKRYAKLARKDAATRARKLKIMIVREQERKGR